MYRIIGTDGKQYGPVTVAQLREWVAEHRADAQTLVQTDGGAEWKPLGTLPEFADAHPSAVPNASSSKWAALHEEVSQHDVTFTSDCTMVGKELALLCLSSAFENAAVEAFLQSDPLGMADQQRRIFRYGLSIVNVAFASWGMQISNPPDIFRPVIDALVGSFVNAIDSARDEMFPIQKFLPARKEQDHFVRQLPPIGQDVLEGVCDAPTLVRGVFNFRCRAYFDELSRDHPVRPYAPYQFTARRFEWQLTGNPDCLAKDVPSAFAARFGNLVLPFVFLELTERSGTAIKRILRAELARGCAQHNERFRG